MKKQIITVLTIVSITFFTNSLHAQESSTAAKSIYFELGGAGVASFNYDMRFHKKEDGLGFKVG